jgi:hypothetical protein
VFRLHIWARRCMHGQRLRAILTAMSHEEHSMLCGVACRTNESVMLETTDHRIVRDHVGHNQLSAARPTMHCSHVYRTSPIARIIDFGAAAVQVRLWICSCRARTRTFGLPQSAALSAFSFRGRSLIETRVLDTERSQVSKTVKQRMIKLLHGDTQSLLKPFGNQVPMAIASTSLNIASVLMTK